MSGNARPIWKQVLRGIAVAAVVIGVPVWYVATPRFANYIERDKVGAVVVALGSCKIGVDEFGARHGRWPSTPAEAGCGGAETKHSTKLAVGAGRIQATLRQVHPHVDGEILALDAMADAEGRVRADPGKPILAWRCWTSAKHGLKFMPPNCRNYLEPAAR